MKMAYIAENGINFMEMAYINTFLKNGTNLKKWHKSYENGIHFKKMA